MRVTENSDGTVTVLFDYTPWSSVSFTRASAFEAASVLLEHLARFEPRCFEDLVVELASSHGWGRS